MLPLRTRIVGLSLAAAVAVGGLALGARPASGQSITGLGQADQQFHGCRQSMTLAPNIATTFCSTQPSEDGAQDP